MQSLPIDPIVLGGVALVVVVLLVLLATSFKKTKKAGPTGPPPLDLRSFGQQGPPAAGPQLAAMNVPVRLAALVVAPAGREGQLPADQALAMMMDQSIPGIAKVIQQHQPQIYRWPGQLSAEGFNRIFFTSTGLSNQGKGTPWCCAAGPIIYKDHRMFVGMLMRSQAENNIAQYSFDKDTKWLDVIRASAN